MTTANQNFIIKIKSLNTGKEEVYNNDNNGYQIKNSVDYIELGNIPATVRYSDYDKMFKGALTVIVQYTESPAEITVSSLDNQLSKTIILSGTPDYTDTGIFKLYSTK